MGKRFICYLAIVVIIVGINWISLYSIGEIYRVKPAQIVNPTTPWYKILLIPLDSRPPCTLFVKKIAALCNIEVTEPPQEFLDHYKNPAKIYALRQWLLTRIKDVDAAIISTDMLLYGGLTASRNTLSPASSLPEIISLLTDIKQQYPHVKLHVFHIIPRLIIADSQENKQFQKKMIQYSILKNQLQIFENPVDYKKFLKLEQELPQQVIQKYENLYAENIIVHNGLIELLEKNVLDSLIIGQDDGHPFGLPNTVKQRMDQQVAQKNGLKGKLFVTRGTDEVALTLVGHIVAKLSGYQPKVYILYSHSAAPSIVMPFMPHSVAKTAQEKLEILNAVEVRSLNEADYVLYIHIGTLRTNESVLQTAANQIKELVKSGHKIAVVDLTEDYFASETVLPYMISQGVDLTRLIAYAGWNTTSNSIGTALTQASVYTRALQAVESTPFELTVRRNNLEFLISRYLDDWYYLKDVQPLLNDQIRFAGLDPYLLDKYYDKVNAKVQRAMQNKTNLLFRNSLYKQALDFQTPDQQHLIITDLAVQSFLPWERTMEIQLEAQIGLGSIN